MIKFGTGGWRAFIGEEFTKDNVRLVAQAVANITNRESVADRGFIIGYDRRFLSDKAGRWFAEVLAANGIVVSFIDKFVPTPIVMFKAKRWAVLTRRASPHRITLQITMASKSSLKVVVMQMKSLPRKLKLKFPLTAQDVKSVDFDQAVEDKLIEIINPMNEFVDSIIDFIDIEAIKKANLRVLIDPMFGVAKTHYKPS